MTWRESLKSWNKKNWTTNFFYHAELLLLCSLPHSGLWRVLQALFRLPAPLAAGSGRVLRVWRQELDWYPLLQNVNDDDVPPCLPFGLSKRFFLNLFFLFLHFRLSFVPSDKKKRISFGFGFVYGRSPPPCPVCRGFVSLSIILFLYSLWPAEKLLLWASIDDNCLKTDLQVQHNS